MSGKFNKNSPFGTILVAFVVSAVCSVLVATTSVILKDEQKRNVINEQRTRILQAIGKYDPSRDLAQQFSQIQTRLVDLRTGRFLSDEAITDLGGLEDYDQKLASTKSNLSTQLDSVTDIASISRLEHYSKVYVYLNDNDLLEAIVLPVRGYGLWGIMYGFIALEEDFNTVRGIQFYEHKETPGLGAEIENPAWTQQWNGKKVYNNENVTLQVIKGKVRAGSSDVQYQIDGLSGATLTSNGVSYMLQFWLGKNGYKPMIDRLNAVGYL